MPNPHPNTHGLRRGGPGRPKGSKNKLTKEIELFFESKVYADAAKARMVQGKAPHLETYWLNQIIGKPVERHELTGDEGGPVRVEFVIVPASA